MQLFGSGIKRFLFLVPLLTGVIYGCATVPRHEYYPESDGAGFPDEQVGILHVRTFAGAQYVWVDGKQVSELFVLYHDKVKLLPGNHSVTWSRSFIGQESYSGSFVFDVEAGHIYKLKVDSCYWCHPFAVSAWIEDETTGAVVAGQSPSWPSWKW